MVGSSRANEKDKTPAYANPNTHLLRAVTFLEGTVEEDDFDSIIDTPPSVAGWEDIHQSVAQGVPEPIGNPRVYSVNTNSLQNPQTNPSSNTANTYLQEVPLLSDWNMGWGQQYMNQGQNAMSSGGISTFGRESSFGSSHRPQVNRNVAGSSFLVCPRDTAPVHTRKNVNFNTNQGGVQGKFEGSFLSLEPGGTSETVSSSQLECREISDKLKEAAPNELKIARSRKATGQTFDDGFMGFQINSSGFSNQFSHVSRMASTNQFRSHGSPNIGLGSSPCHILHMQPNDRQLGRADKLTEAASTELKMVRARKATGQTLDGDITGFQRNNRGFSNQFGNVDRVTSTNYEIGVHSKLNSEQGSSRNHALQMQHSDSRNTRSGDLDHYKGNRSVHSGTLGGNSAHFFNSQQHNLKPPESVKPSWMTSSYTPSEQLQHFHSSTANIPNYAASTVDSQFQKLDFHVRPHHKRTAVAPQSASHWVQRQKIIHPTVMPKPPIPVTTALIHPSIPFRSRTQPAGSVKPRVPVGSAPALSHITWKDPDATSKLSGYKCLLCKRDLALTSEGPVFQPSVPPPVAVLRCGHTFHDQCLQNITPDDQAKDPPCIPCAIGEN